MCGLSGAFGALTFKEEKAVKDLLIFNQVRGEDSTGVASVSRHLVNGQHDILLAKETGPPVYLFDTHRFTKVFGRNNSAYISHNRYKTQGDISRKNAHPFLFDDIVGAHNGTIDWQNKARMERV